MSTATSTVGTAIPAWRPESVTEERMRTMALFLRDPNPIHYDTDVTAAAGMGDRAVNQGPSNVAYVMNMLIAWAGSPAAVRRLNVRFNANVFAGDEVEATGEVTATEVTDAGTVATCDVRLTRADGTVLVSGIAEVLLPAA